MARSADRWWPPSFLPSLPECARAAGSGPSPTTSRVHAHVAAGAACLLAIGLAAQPARAQAPEDVRNQFYLSVPPSLQPPSPPRARPAASALSPLGFGAQWGDVFGGMGYQARARYSQGDDAVAAAGFGLGDGRDWIGVEVAVFSFTTFRRGFFTRWGVDVKVHRQLGDGLSVAAGWEGVHLRDSDSGESRYLAATKVWRLRDSATELFSDLVLTVGAGDGRFLSEPDFMQGAGGVNAFASASVRVAEPVSLIVDWSGQDLATGLSVAPFRAVPLVVTAALVDLTGAAGDGSRFTGSTGLSLQTCSFLPC